ncbi:hypothetical protein HYDPIDRAFT_102629, partial [Hydnomerulius pinastri MD-312]
MAKFISCQVREAHLDLDEPISLFREALDLRPHDHPDRPLVSLSCPNEPGIINLASALLRRFEQHGDGNDLDEAIQHYRAALQLTPVGHPHRSLSLNNLASALWTRFSQRGDGNDLDEAIQHHRAALQLTPAGHPHRSLSLNNLANALSTRF